MGVKEEKPAALTMDKEHHRRQRSGTASEQCIG